MAEDNMSGARKQAGKNKRKQGHKLVLATVIIILIPVVFIGYVLATSAVGQNRPVEGNRFGSADLEPRISEDEVNSVKETVSSISGVQSVEVNLKSATLRVSLDLNDDADTSAVKAAANEAYDNISDELPIETYFTNKEDGKMYDLEINAYNYLVDDTHSQDGQIVVEITKTGDGKKTTDVLTTPRDKGLVKEITR